jgi:hypothetical protein
VLTVAACGGTAGGGVDIEAITALAATALVLGESELGVDWELGPSDRFARYAFDVMVGRVLAEDSIAMRGCASRTSNRPGSAFSSRTRRRRRAARSVTPRS